MFPDGVGMMVAKLCNVIGKKYVNHDEGNKSTATGRHIAIKSNEQKQNTLHTGAGPCSRPLSL